MKINKIFAIHVAIIGVMCICLFNARTAWAGSISETYKYAWSENSGWHNWHAANGNVAVESTYLTGYVWAENIGWIKLGVDAGGPYDNDASDNWGVNLDGSGNLSGYAWSETVGWINFNSANGGGVSIDPATGKFDGYAWGENIGWIHFQNASPQYYVQTDPLVKYYRSKATGNWSNTATWEQSSDNITWGPATAVPDASSAGTTIQSPHTVTVDASVTTDQTTVADGGALAVNNGVTLTLANGDGTDLTVQGDLTNAGALTCADGSEVLFSGASASTFTSSGTTTFKTLTLNKGAAATALNITGEADMTVSTALTVTRGTVDLSAWIHNLLLGGSLSIGTDGRWVKHGNNAYYLQFTGAACTVSDTSSTGPQNLGHVKVDE